MNIQLGKTYNVKVYDSVENVWWEDEFTTTKFLTSGTFAGAWLGLDSDGIEGIVEPNEFVSEV